MTKKPNKSLYILTILIILLSLVTSAVGLLYKTGGTAYDVVNQYGDTVKIYGDGLYAHDSHFSAPIFRGTDFTILFIAIPTLIIALALDLKKKTLKTRLFLMSVISLFTYYSASIAFGVTYNALHLAYIALFSASFFGLIIAIGSIDSRKIAESVGKGLPYKGIYTFLALTGFALIAAWLPDIISSLLAGRSLALIEVYTTAITYVLDMGVIGPVALICLFQLRKREGMGYILLSMLLTVCALVGIMLPIQSVFQAAAGIELPLPAVVTKVASFVILAFFALYYNFRLYKTLK